MNSNNFIEKAFIYGKHAAVATLKNNLRAIYKIYTTKDTFSIVEPYKHLQNKVHIVTAKDFEKLLPNIKAHQNILIIANKLEFKLTDLKLDKKHSVIICLDQITDPNNIGAILRSAAAFKADCVIITNDNSPQNFSSIYKISSGASELVPIIRVINLSNTLIQLKKFGYWIIGLDVNTTNNFENHNLPEKTVIVLGSENKGIRTLVLKNCDFLYKIPMDSQIDSLNVSNSGAIALYEYYKRYKFHLS